MKIDFSLFLLFSLFVFGCSSGSTPLKSKNDQHYKKIASEKFGNNYKIIFNSDSSYVVAYTYLKGSGQALEPPLKYIIYNLENDSVIYEDNLVNGQVSWISNQQIKVTTTPEVVRADDDEKNSFYGYIYDVRLNRKIDNQAIKK